MESKQSKSFWTSLPGIITATATFLTAIGGLLVTLNQMGMFDTQHITADKPVKRESTRSTDKLVVSNLDVTSASGKEYKVMYHGLQPGSQSAVDRTYVYTNVPPLLKGETYIMPAHDDKWNKSDLFMSFTVNKDVTVYVARDTRYKRRSSWLITFEDTEYEWKTGLRNHTYRLYKKKYTAGEVLLGGNIAPPSDKGSYSTYTVILAD